MDCAVLFLIFNRPDTTKTVFEAIRLARPKRLYVAADGARVGKPLEVEQCNKAREIATSVDWDCEVRILFRDENLGCRRAISGALDWFFSKEEYGIILEDDCLPSLSWFQFAQEMLLRFRDDERVMCISANHFYGGQHELNYSYFFSAYAHCWGWASWRRAWSKYDRNMDHWPALRNTKFLRDVLSGGKIVDAHWKNIFDLAYEGVQVDSWAYRWLFTCWIQRGLTILPMKNLVINLGVGGSSTHTMSVPIAVSSIQNEELTFPLKHPPVMVRDVESDRWETKYVYGISYANSIKYFLRHLPFFGNFLVSIRNFLRSFLA